MVWVNACALLEGGNIRHAKHMVEVRELPWS